MLKTKATMTPLNRDQVFGGDEFFEMPIPPQTTDIEFATKVEDSIETTAKSSGYMYILIFALMFLLNFAKQLFWGSVRNLQAIFTLSLIAFP